MVVLIRVVLVNRYTHVLGVFAPEEAQRIPTWHNPSPVGLRHEGSWRDPPCTQSAHTVHSRYLF